MKYLLITVWVLFTFTAYGQDFLLNKSGSSYFYKGQEYKCKDLSIVYSGYDLPLNLYNDGRNKLKSSISYAIGGALVFGVGYGTLALWSDKYGRLIGRTALASGVLTELAAFVLLVTGKTNIRKARREFNFRMLEIHGYNSGVSIGFSETKNGIGMVVQF